MKKTIILLVVFALAITSYAQQPGTLDNTFIGSVNSDGANGVVLTTSIQSDGKIIIGGGFTSYNGTSRNKIARVTVDDNLDSTFNPGIGPNDNIKATSIQSDGKIIIGGGFTSYNGTVKNKIARLNLDGTLDVNFNVGTGVNGTVNSISIQSDGKIIIGGNFTSYNGVSRQQGIARLNADGTLDSAFNTSEMGPTFFGFSANVLTTSIQSNGKIIIGGSFCYSSPFIRNIVRLNADGTVDSSFNIGNGAGNLISTCGGNVNKIFTQSDGKIIIVGSFNSFNQIARNNIVRLNADGTVDSSFNPGIGSNGNISTTFVQSDGKIIIGGSFTTYNGTTKNRIARLNIDGTLESGNTFNIGTGADLTINAIIIQSDGKIIIGGDFTSFNGTARGGLHRLNANGSIDSNFNPVIGANEAVNTISIQSNGKVIIGGVFNAYNGIGINRIARLNTDGNIDNTFNPQTETNGNILTSCLQSDGKILIGGFFSFNSSIINRFSRLNTNGTLDSTFNIGSGVGGSVYCISIQSDGKIIIGGDFASYNGTARNKIARVNSNGTLDSTFNIGTGSDGTIYAISIQSNGKIIIGGTMFYYNGTATRGIARLNADGTLDSTFNSGTKLNGHVRSTSIQSDGKIIISGFFNSYDGIPVKNIARLNIDGTLDNTFNIGSGANNDVYTTSIQSDGKIIIGGVFTTYNGISKNRIARLNPDGTLDNTFNIGTGVNGQVYTNSIQSDGKIIIGGGFISYNGTSRNRVARINGGVLTTISITGPGGPALGADWGVDYFLTDAGGGIWTANNIVLPGGPFKFRLSGNWVTNWGASSWPSGTGFQDGPNIPGISGSYSVIFNQNTGEYIFNQSLSIDDQLLNDKIIIYPNPAHSILNISVNDGIQLSKITIVDITGKVVLEQSENLSTINVEKLAKGVYILTANSGDKKYQEKFIKE